MVRLGPLEISFMELEFIGKDQWESLVEISPQGTIFHTDAILSSFGVEHDYALIKRKGNPLGAIALPRAKSMRIFPYQAYNGFIFHPWLLSKNTVKRVEGQFQMLEFLASEILERYEDALISCIDFNSTVDLRAFHWCNYHEADLPSFSSNVHYTSVLPTSRPLDYSLMRKGRISSLNKSKKFQLKSELSDNLSNLKEIYSETFERQGIKLEKATLDIAYSQFHKLINSDEAIVSATSCEGQLASMAVFGIDNKRAYYLFGASRTELRSKEVGTANLAWSIEKLNEMGVKEIDMVGVNSPQRGSFKLSFGGDLRPYYQIKRVDCR